MIERFVVGCFVGLFGGEVVEPLDGWGPFATEGEASFFDAGTEGLGDGFSGRLGKQGGEPRHCLIEPLIEIERVDAGGQRGAGQGKSVV